jgi:hypothetical protein
LKYESFAKITGWERALKDVREVYSVMGDGEDW